MTLRFCRTVAVITGCALSLQFSAFAAGPLSSSSTDPKISAPATVAQLPDAPSVVAQAQTPAPPTADKKAAEATPQKPKGAAAAEVQRSTGTAASTPSGAAIAPAKQKRSRSLLIRMGALAGAAVAIGTVVALSSGSPSKPPGAQ